MFGYLGPLIESEDPREAQRKKVINGYVQLFEPDCIFNKCYWYVRARYNAVTTMAAAASRDLCY
jgi:hypothetical protein